MKHSICSLLLFMNLNLFAQSGPADEGIVYYTLGNDTTVIQYFSFNNHEYKTVFIQFTGAITKCVANGRLTPSGDIEAISSVNYRLDSTGNWEMTTKGENVFNGDSSVYTAINAKGAVVNRRSFSGRGIVANGMDIASFYTFPYMGFYAPRIVGDTLFHRQLSFNGYRRYMVYRQAKKEIRVGSNLMGYLTLLTDKKGKLQAIEGVGSSLNIRASLDRKHTAESLLDDIAKRRNAAGGTAVRTLADTARVTLGATAIEVYYWRPHKRGREIFGNVVPWGRVWRTGANNATQLRISKDIIIGGKELPKGAYGIWSLPTENGWELIINKNAGAWGTDHDPAADLFRIPLKIGRLDMAQETLSITLSSVDDTKAVLRIAWDTYTAETMITIQ